MGEPPSSSVIILTGGAHGEQFRVRTPADVSLSGRIDGTSMSHSISESTAHAPAIPSRRRRYPSLSECAADGLTLKSHGRPLEDSRMGVVQYLLALVFVCPASHVSPLP